MALRMTEEEYADFVKRTRPWKGYEGHTEKEPKKRPKYGNRRVEVEGKKFDSIHEADVYKDLMVRVKAGELRCVCRQVKFDLPGGIQYIADFVAIDNRMNVEGVYDAKSPATAKDKVYVMKKKLMLEQWGIEIKEV